MKNFHNAKISYSENSVFLKLSALEEGLLIIVKEAILEISRDGVPLGFELFDASTIGFAQLNAIELALRLAAVPFSLNDDVDILTVNLNEIDEEPIKQAPGTVNFAFNKDKKLASIVATVAEKFLSI